MGCSASRDLGTTTTVRESWYYPLPRSISAPIQSWLSLNPESCQDACNGNKDANNIRLLGKHRPTITASDHAPLPQKLSDYHVAEGLNAVSSKLHKPGMVGHNRPQLRHLFENEEDETDEYSKAKLQHQENTDDSSTDALGMSSMQHSLSVSSLNLMADVPKHESDSHVDGNYSSKANYSWGQSLSFNTVHELDTGFNETGSPIWPRPVHEPLEEQKFLDEESCGGALPQASELNGPSPILMLNSLEGSTGALFDPALLAAFEEAVDNTRLCDDEWMLVDHVSNDSSSSSSSGKYVWVSSTESEDNSDAESVDVDYIPSNAQPVDLVPANALQHDFGYNNSYLGQKEDSSLILERFERKCPPRGEDKVVLYFTSLRGIRKTFQDCQAVKLILDGLGVDVDERDVWMHLKFREELSDLLGHQKLPVPRLFIKGRYIGGAEEIKQLHEDGILVQLLKDLPTFGTFRKACETCGDVRFIPCIHCSGSCKVYNEDGDVERCPVCNENGLIMCPMCCSWQVSNLQSYNIMTEESLKEMYSHEANAVCCH